MLIAAIWRMQEEVVLLHGGLGNTLAGQLEGVRSGVQGDIPPRQQPHHEHRGARDHVRHMLCYASRPDRCAVPGRIDVCIPLHGMHGVALPLGRTIADGVQARKGEGS